MHDRENFDFDMIRDPKFRGVEKPQKWISPSKNLKFKLNKQTEVFQKISLLSKDEPFLEVKGIKPSKQIDEVLMVKREGIDKHPDPVKPVKKKQDKIMVASRFKNYCRKDVIWEKRAQNLDTIRQMRHIVDSCKMKIDKFDAQKAENIKGDLESSQSPFRQKEIEI